MQTYLVRLTFTAPLHYKKDGVGEESTASWLHSDTLYSAIWSVWSRYGLGDGADALLRRFQAGEAPFRLTSAFPFMDGSTYLLPKPRGLWLSEQPEKVLRKAEWLPLSAALQLFAGEALKPEDVPKKDRLNEAFRQNLRPRVTFKADGSSNYFQTGQTFFAPECGLWFLVQADPAFLPLLEEALRHLGEDGLGGNRTTGSGTFTHDGIQPVAGEWLELLTGPAGANRHVLLSLAHPAPGEELTEGAIFETVRRGGWAPVGQGHEVRRQIVRMITEGSLLSASIQGRVVDVTPEGWDGPHHLFRSGLAFTVPVLRKEAE